MKSLAELLELAAIMNRASSKVGTIAEDWKATAVEAPIRPRVAILIPTHRGIHPATTRAIDRMILASEHRAEIRKIVREAAAVHLVRNHLIQTLYKENIPFDYALFVDDDMIPPPDALTTLLREERDIIGAVCTTRNTPLSLNVRELGENSELIQMDIENRGVFKVGAIGTAFLLVSRRVLDTVAEYTIRHTWFTRHYGMNAEVAAQQEKIMRGRFEVTGYVPWFEFLRHPGYATELAEDFSFCIKARECGFEIFGNTRTSVGHIDAGKNRMYTIEDYWKQPPPKPQPRKRDVLALLDEFNVQSS